MEALEQRFGKGRSPRNQESPSSSSFHIREVPSGPQIPDPSASGEQSPRLKLKPLSRRKPTPSDTTSAIGLRDESILALDDFGDSDDLDDTSLPQHASVVSYYRIMYRGVISLLCRPELSSPRNGAFLSYGDIIAGSDLLPAEMIDLSTQIPLTPTRKEATNTHDRILQTTLNTTRKVIRVDRVLTGGYTLDAIDAPSIGNDETPRRGNTLPIVSVVRQASHEDDGSTSPLGYLLAENKGKPLFVRLDEPPVCESGSFLYRVISSAPIAVHTGPFHDAPTTKGMLVPGTTHEVSMRVVDGSVNYLRLTRRQGWVADRRIHVGASHGPKSGIVVMREVTHIEEGASVCNISTMSVAASSVATPLSESRRRHRVPRRQRVHPFKKDMTDSSAIPVHVPGPAPQTLPQSRTGSYDSDHQVPPSHDRSIFSPLSNISLLSDESSIENSQSQRGPEITTPDRSFARSTVSASLESTQLPCFFLMRVNAPRGLKILDAPHFQVNNLIHGNHPGGLLAPSPSKDLSVKSGSQSIFQTMSGGHHTTTLTSKTGNPAVFDSNTKARKLPRGSVFEASKRVEASGAFSQGSGLIKLSDNSGWAIVPKREELDEQYRSISGALAGMKEGEASRAFQEIGNAIVRDRPTPIYMRIQTREGLAISLAPNPTIEDDITSPSSSAGGTSSLVSAGNGSSIVRGQDSDVVSSVGSSFLDSMFRTPKRKGRESDESDKGRREAGNPPKAPASERLPFSNILPCGAYVEVDDWVKAPDGGRSTEYARLRGGQGWIPRSLNGKAVTEIISPPEARFGSFWFRVQDKGGIKVRFGPSRRAPTIKSDDGVYFRFECGEYLRASEVVTFFRQGAPTDCYAKLYRNRHIRLYGGHGEIRPLTSLTVQAEWVQVFSSGEIFLEECTAEPRIERHHQGWRYNVVLDTRVQVRKGPSLEAEVNGVVLLGGESILINERVTGPDDMRTWLRLKDGQGWVHTGDDEEGTLMIPHSIRHRTDPLGRPTKAGRPEQEDIAYNAIIARLFHSGSELDGHGTSNLPQSRPRKKWT